MTEIALRELVRAKVGEALAKSQRPDVSGGTSMKLNEHFRKAAGHHKKLAKSHTVLADAHNQLAHAAETRADFTSAKCHKAISDEHAEIARAHEKHAKHLSEMAAESVDAG